MHGHKQHSTAMGTHKIGIARFGIQTVNHKRESVKKYCIVWTIMVPLFNSFHIRLESLAHKTEPQVVKCCGHKSELLQIRINFVCKMFVLETFM